MQEAFSPSNQGYPDAPWALEGRIVLGQVKARGPLTPMNGVHHLLDRRMLLFLGRYRRGTLDYSELVLAAYARRGLRPGLEIRHIWVDNTPALLGGVHIWGLPKKLATFDWSDNRVRVSDDEGPITTLTWSPGKNSLARLPVPLWFFGIRGSALLHTTAKARCRIGSAQLTVDEWTDRLPALTGTRARLGAICDPSRAIVPPARILAHLPAGQQQPQRAHRAVPEHRPGPRPSTRRGVRPRRLRETGPGQRLPRPARHGPGIAGRGPETGPGPQRTRGHRRTQYIRIPGR
jgi:hypothetical protein